jgi:hypothetical protein
VLALHSLTRQLLLEAQEGSLEVVCEVPSEVSLQEECLHAGKHIGSALVVDWGERVLGREG